MSPTETERGCPPRTSTPPQQPHQDETAPDLDEKQEFNLDPLGDYNGPIDDDFVDPSEPPTTVLVEFPVLKPFGKIGANTQILARRADALVKGAHVIDKGFLLQAQKASRRLFRTVFPKELELLEAMLCSVERSRNVFNHAPLYRVSQKSYQLLLRILWDLRRQAEDSFLLAGKYPLTRDSTIRFANVASNNGLPKNNARMSEILNPMASAFEFQSSTGRHLSSVPEEADQMRRMGSHDNSRSRDPPPHMQYTFPPVNHSPSASQNGRQQAGNPPSGDPDDDDSDGKESVVYVPPLERNSRRRTNRELRKDEIGRARCAAQR
ncbi:hypothetical protein FB451DRAFT_1359047 [Mycena latifolia]|nr:hypothetical protein FB451DRAFT_1359047 [Mycena latifolia]